MIDVKSPFGYGRGEGVDAGSDEREWIVSKDRYKYDSLFDSLNPVDGKVSGAGKLSLSHVSVTWLVLNFGLWMRR